MHVLLVEQLGWGGAKALTYFTAFFASIEEDENKTAPIWQHCGKLEQDRGNEEIVASVMTHIESRASNGAGVSVNYSEVTHSLLSGGLKVRSLSFSYPKSY